MHTGISGHVSSGITHGKMSVGGFQMVRFVSSSGVVSVTLCLVSTSLDIIIGYSYWTCKWNIFRSLSGLVLGSGFYGAWGVDVNVAFFALLHLHKLHGLEGNWRAKMESVGAPPDTTEWVGSICPPLLEDFASSSAECPSTQESTSLVSG